jgi:protein-arginine kinase activator protein McsA
MSALQKLKTAVPVLGEDEQTYECQDCGSTFESDSDADRATCVNCLSDEVDPA